MAAQMEPVRVFLVCSGLGRIRRGFEAFFQECFETLSEEPGLDMSLFRGGELDRSYRQRERVLPHVPRSSSIAPPMGRALRRNVNEVEQITFALSLLPHIVRGRPQVIYFSQYMVGRVLLAFRKRTGRTFRLLFRNGVPLEPPYPWWDHIHQLTPLYYDRSLAAGETSDRLTLLSNAVRIEPHLESLSDDAQRTLRVRLGLPTTGRSILLSAGAVDRGHKRMDYLVREMARLPKAIRPFVLMVGQRTEQTPEVDRLAQELLGEGEYRIRTAPRAEMPDYYRSADLFALASQSEGFGRVYAEALSHGLPCLVHDWEVTRQIFGPHGRRGDLSEPGMLAGMAEAALAEGNSEAARQERHRYAFASFSWDALRPRYVEMLRSVANAASV